MKTISNYLLTGLLIGLFYLVKIIEISFIFFFVCSIEYDKEIIYQQQLDLEEDGPAIDLHFNNSGNTYPMLVYATGFGSIVGWDLRQSLPRARAKGNTKSVPAFKFDNDLRDGILTSVAISPDQVCIFSL